MKKYKHNIFCKFLKIRFYNIYTIYIKNIYLKNINNLKYNDNMRIINVININITLLY